MCTTAAFTKAVLHVSAGPCVGQTIELGEGETVTIGRTESADFCVPEDPEISSRHFQASCLGNVCRIRDLGSTNGTFLGQRPITEAELTDGEELRAGRSLFLLRFEGALAERVEPEGLPDIRSPLLNSQELALLPEIGADGLLARRSVEIAEPIEFEEDAARLLLDEEQTPAEFLARLTEKMLWADALKFLACAVPKRHAVWWSSQCAREGCGDELSADEKAVLEAAEQWARSPNEAERREAMDAAECAGLDKAAAWPAVAAFWSSGSLAPPSMDAVPPADELTGQAAATAITLAVVFREPHKAQEKRQHFLEKGLELARSDCPWEQGSNCAGRGEVAAL